MKKFFALTLVVLSGVVPASSAHAATSGQRNALHSAQAYIAMAGFSKAGLTKQLVYERFS